MAVLLRTQTQRRVGMGVLQEEAMTCGGSGLIEFIKEANYYLTPCPGCEDCVCANCNGIGRVPASIMDTYLDTNVIKYCPTCNGTGRKG